jgi:hypothetical protein
MDSMIKAKDTKRIQKHMTELPALNCDQDIVVNICDSFMKIGKIIK